MKRFKLLRDYEWPGGIISRGTIKTDVDWEDYFPTLDWEDYEEKTDWFEKIELTHDVRYNMCKDQDAQIDCRNTDCFHHENGKCLNISPAITLSEGRGKCWSFDERSDEEYLDGDQDLEDEDDECDVDEAGVISMRDKWNRDSLRIKQEELMNELDVDDHRKKIEDDLPF